MSSRDNPNDAFLKWFYKEYCVMCGSQRCGGVYDETWRCGCEAYIEEVLRKEQSP